MRWYCNDHLLLTQDARLLQLRQRGGDSGARLRGVPGDEGAPLGAVLILAHRQLADELGELLAGSVVRTLSTLHARTSPANPGRVRVDVASQQGAQVR